MKSGPLLALALSLVLAAGASAQNPVLAGRMDGNVYVSATGEFKIEVPVLPELGGTVEDTDNVVTFSDSFNTHISIACFTMDASQKWEFETRGVREYLLYFFNEVVLVDFQRRFPGSKIESARFLPDLQDGALITYALLPGGSYFEKHNAVLDTPSSNPVTAKRGTILFVRNRHIFIISTELAERATQRSTYNQTAEQENSTLSDRLITLVGRLQFTSPKSKP